VAAPSFLIRTTKWSDGYTVAVTGEIDVHTAGRLWSAIEQAFGNGAVRVVIDLANTTFMDSTGLNVIVRAGVRFGAERIAIGRPTPPVARVLEISGLRRSFDVHGAQPDQGAASTS
jgi:anti-anti-sigma factor